MGGGSNERINFLNKDEKYIKKNKIKVLGTETYLDRECTKFSVALIMMGQAATKLEEDVEIPAATFEVPEGIEIQTMSRGPMGGGQMGGGGGFGGGEF